MSRSRTSLAVLGVLATLALTGCGALHPGAAVQVGEETIPVSEVNEVAGDFCSAIEPQLDGQAQTIPNGFLRGGIAGTLALRSVADQVAADYGVSPESERYLEAMAEVRNSVAAVPEDLRENVVAVQSAPQYVEAVQAAVGEQVLQGDGEYDDFVNAGGEAFTTWLAENDVEFDPSLNTTLEEGQIATADGAVSFAVSEDAKAGLEEQPNAVLARQLPSSHRCGR